MFRLPPFVEAAVGVGLLLAVGVLFALVRNS